jgi:hypothetical protein
LEPSLSLGVFAVKKTAPVKPQRLHQRSNRWKSGTTSCPEKFRDIQRFSRSNACFVYGEHSGLSHRLGSFVFLAR